MKWVKTYLTENASPCQWVHAQCCHWVVTVLAEGPTLERDRELQPCCFPSVPHQCVHTANCKTSQSHWSPSVLPLESTDLMKTMNTNWSPWMQWSFTRCGPCSYVKGTEVSTSMEQTSSCVKVITNFTTFHLDHRPSLTCFHYYLSGILYIQNISILNVIFIHVVHHIVEKLRWKVTICF